MERGVVIYYFSGTGNSRMIAETVGQQFGSLGYNYVVKNIEDGLLADAHENYMLHGFVFPTYAFGLPRIMENFLLNLPAAVGKESFLLTTMGGGGEHGFGTARVLNQGFIILRQKGYRVLGGRAFHMPDNFIVVLGAPPQTEAERMVNAAKVLANDFPAALLAGQYQPAPVPLWQQLSLTPFYHFFRTGLDHGMGIFKFKTTAQCNACGYCVQHCPTSNITIKDGKPQWGKNCEFCLRCINTCPQAAIECGKSRGKRRYHLCSQ